MPSVHATATVTFDDKVWGQLYRKMIEQGQKDTHVRVGVLQNGQHSESDFSLAELAAVQEFGSIKAKIPERSFLRSTFYVRRVRELMLTLHGIAVAVVNNKLDLRRAFGILGQWAVSEVRSTITEIDISPPLAPSTVAKKGSSKPLVDTGQLLNAITYVVENE